MSKCLLVAPVLLLAACGPVVKTAPVPDSTMSARSGVRVETLRRGHTVYLSQCGRCHEHVMPKDVTKSDWHVVVPGMAWNAGISAADEKALTAYILAAKQ